MLLALDTATRQAGLALYDGQVVRAEATWHAGRHHTEWLAPAVHEALSRIRASAADLVAIAVTSGPGSFTGLRVALSLGKGLAAARDLPIVGVPTLDVAAYPHVETGHALCTTLPAGRGRHAFAFYGTEATRAALGGTAPVLGNVVAVAEAIAAFLDGTAAPLRVVGELTRAERAHLGETLPERVEVLSPALAVRRPAALAEMAWARVQAADVDDLHALEPLYLHLTDTPDHE